MIDPDRGRGQRDLFGVRVVLASLWLAGCGSSDEPGDGAATTSSPTGVGALAVSPSRSAPAEVSAAPAASPSTAPSAAPSASGLAAPGFVRGPQFVLPIDLCVFSTGGSSCMSAVGEEKDPMTLRLMLHIVEARAAQASAALHKTRVLEIPNIEQAGFCKEAGPCGGTNDSGTELDSAYACLTRASIDLASDPVRSSASHARACRCHAKTFAVPVQGGTGLLGCDHGKLVRWGKTMPVAQAVDVELCSQCDPAGGAAACEREIARLASVDPALSEHIARVHVPRCRTPMP